MADDRRFAIKKAIMDYLLLDAKEQERLGVPIPPKVCTTNIHVIRLKHRNITEIKYRHRPNLFVLILSHYLTCYIIFPLLIG